MKERDEIWEYAPFLTVSYSDKKDGTASECGEWNLHAAGVVDD